MKNNVNKEQNNVNVNNRMQRQTNDDNSLQSMLVKLELRLNTVVQSIDNLSKRIETIEQKVKVRNVMNSNSSFNSEYKKKNILDLGMYNERNANETMVANKENSKEHKTNVTILKRSRESIESSDDQDESAEINNIKSSQREI